MNNPKLGCDCYNIDTIRNLIIERFYVLFDYDCDSAHFKADILFYL